MAARMHQILACEERLVNCWPALDTLLMDGWVVRFANGYSGRANSASALTAGAVMDSALLSEICGFFRGRGLSPAIRVTPLADAGLGERLQAEGWTPVTRSVGMISAGLSFSAPAEGLVLEPAPTRGWLDGVSALQDAAKRNPDHLAAIVGRIRRPVVFATLRRGGAPVAYGLCVVDRGMAEIGSIVVDPAHRGAGLGRALVSGVIGWAHQTGARQVFLQVEAGNAIARSLYESLGFSDLYDYCEYRLL